MGARKAMRNPTVERAMFVRTRRQRDGFKRELQRVTDHLELERGKYKVLQGRYAVLLRVGPFYLMRDLLAERKWAVHG